MREGATNVIRHSGASHCSVTVQAQAGDAGVEVLDDGAGAACDPGARTPRRRQRPGGLRERAASLRGRIEAGHGSGRRLPARGLGPVWPAAGRSAMTRVLIAEDQGMVRGALATLLELEDDLEVVAQVGRGDEVLAPPARSPDVALLDIEMPGADRPGGARAAGGRAAGDAGS